MTPNLPPSGAQPEKWPAGATPGTTPGLPTEQSADEPEFDPYQRVPEINCSGSSVPYLLKKRRKSRKVRPDGGLFDPSLFQDGAAATTSGRFRFPVDRDSLVDATEALVSMVGRSTKRPPVARIVLSEDWIKIAAVNERGGFVETLIFPEYPAPVSERGVLVKRPIPLKQGRQALPPATAPICFYIYLAKMLDITRSGAPGAHIYFEFDAKKKRVLVSGQRVYTRIPNRSPDEFADYRHDAGTPIEVGTADPTALREGLALAALFVRAERDPDVPKYFEYASLRDGMVLGANFRGVLAAVQAKGLAGVEAVFHATDLAPLAKLMLRFTPRTTRLFETSSHWLIADWHTCVGVPKVDAALPPRIYEPSLSREPGCRTLVPRSDFLSRLNWIAGGVKGEPGGDVVRFRLTGTGADARLVLQARDTPKENDGVAQISCFRAPPDGKTTVTGGVNMMVSLQDLRQAIIHFDTPNVEFAVLPPLPGAFKPPVLRLSHEGPDGLSAQIFIFGRIVV